MLCSGDEKMDDCIFCKIIKGEVPSEKVYEDEYVIAFLDIAPVNKGHTLVVSTHHHETLFDIPDEHLEKLATTLKRVATAVKEAVNAGGISIGMSNYKAAGQVVPHAHFHVMPRYERDGLKLWPQGRYEQGEMKEYGEKIRKAL
jgi:histidine triad (HIT) family protein